MKAIVKDEPGNNNMSVSDRSVPEVGVGQILDHIKATGICCNDVSILNGTHKRHHCCQLKRHNGYPPGCGISWHRQ